MIPKECKRLAEVDFPIAVVSKHSAREKSIRHGHPSTLHLWWARRPLAACRAMLMALLLPDPCDPHCPAEFKTKARDLFKQSMLAGKPIKTDDDLRGRLLAFIGDFADWDNAGNAVYLEIGRGLVKAAHPEETPLVVDPFAGGGSIPLEALRLGCDAFASDLNPVACLINKVLLEDIPRHGPELTEELRRVGDEVKKAAEKELAEFYPRDPDGARPIAYLWARTVRCESPNCGAEIPLVRSFWLCKKAERRRALRTKVVRPSKGIPSVEFEIVEPVTEKDVRGGTVSRAKATCVCCNTVLAPERVRAQLAAQRGGADVVFDAKGKRTGGATLLAVVTLREEQSGRHYRLSSVADYTAVWKAQQRLKAVAATERPDGLSAIPDEPLPPIGTLGFRVQRYGIIQWRDLFTARQTLAIIQLVRGSHNARKGEQASGQLAHLVSLVISKHVELMSANCPWEPVAECPRKTYNMQALPMRWDYAEGIVTSDSSGSLEITVNNSVSTLGTIGSNWAIGSTSLADSCKTPLQDAASVWFTDPPYYDAVPYSDLSALFFVWLKRLLPHNKLMQDPFGRVQKQVRRAGGVSPLILHPSENQGADAPRSPWKLFLDASFDPTNTLTPKSAEIVQDETRKVNGRRKDQGFFETQMGQAFAQGRLTLRDDGIACIVFAHKSTEGWEALIGGLLRAGWVIHASWPIQTEQAHRPRARDSASLATSVHLICRPRPDDAPVGDWGHVLRELPRRVGEWMNRLQEEGVRGADLVFACIGPALEAFSRYSKVVDAEEREIPLGGNPEAREARQRGFLAYVWEVVGRAALEQVLGTAESRARNGAAGTLEEDARLTALFLWTLQATTQESEPVASTDEDAEEPEPDEEDEDDAPSSKKKKKGLSLPFDVARRFAQPLGIHLDAWEGRCIETEKGIVRLIPVLDRAEQLFGQDGAEAVAERLEKHCTGPVQLSLFAELDEPTPPKLKVRKRKGGADVSDESLHRHRGATTLDHVHAAMLLQSSGRANALRALLKSEIERGPDFLRLANALSALYPKDSEEKRLLDAMLLAVPR